MNTKRRKSKVKLPGKRLRCKPIDFTPTPRQKSVIAHMDAFEKASEASNLVLGVPLEDQPA